MESTFQSKYDEFCNDLLNACPELKDDILSAKNIPKEQRVSEYKTKVLRETLKEVEFPVSYLVGERYFKILNSMCNLKEKLRITPEDLYYNTIFDDIRPLYKLPDEVEVKIDVKKFSLDDDTYTCIQDFLIDYKRNFLSIHVGVLLEKFLSIKNIEHDIYYETACMYIADLLFNARSSNNMTLIEMGAIPRYSKYSVSDIRKKMIEICKALDWKVFPNKSLDEWNMD